MGWCSATDTFDKVAEFVLDTDEPDEKKAAVLYSLAETLEDGDWDCQSDSDYYGHPVVQQVMRQLHPHWFETEF